MNEPGVRISRDKNETGLAAEPPRHPERHPFWNRASEQDGLRPPFGVLVGLPTEDGAWKLGPHPDRVLS